MCSFETCRHFLCVVEEVGGGTWDVEGNDVAGLAGGADDTAVGDDERAEGCGENVREKKPVGLSPQEGESE